MRIRTQRVVLGFLFITANSLQAGAPVVVATGDPTLQTLLFEDTQLNAIIIKNTQHKQFPVVVEYAIPEQELFQIYTHKQSAEADATKLVQNDIKTYADYVYGGFCGRHAPKNAIFGLAAFDDYTKLAQTPSLGLADRQKLIKQFITYAESITFLTPASLQTLQKINEHIICYRTDLVSRIRMQDAYGRPIPKNEYIHTKSTYNDESENLTHQMHTLASMPAITSSDITLVSTPKIAQATSNSSMKALPKDLIEQIVQFRYEPTYRHAFTLMMNLDNLHDTRTTNHVIAVIVYKTRTQTAFVFIDSGFLITTNHYDFNNTLIKQELSSENLLHGAAAQTFITLFTTTPLPAAVIPQGKSPQPSIKPKPRPQPDADVHEQPETWHEPEPIPQPQPKAKEQPTPTLQPKTLLDDVQLLVAHYREFTGSASKSGNPQDEDWQTAIQILVTIKKIAQRPDLSYAVSEYLIDNYFTLEDIEERIASARAGQLYVPYIHVLTDPQRPHKLSYQLLIEQYQAVARKNPEKALMLLNKIDRFQKKDAQRGRSYAPLFVSNMGLTQTFMEQEQKRLTELNKKI